MIDVFDRLIAAVIGTEGGYVNNPDDTGGETIWGITVATARKYGYFGDMKAMPRAEAVAIYRHRFWIEPEFDQVAPLSEAVAAELLDTGINLGVGVAGTFLQRALNALNRQAKDYPDIKVDGDVGPATLAALASYFKVRPDGEAVLLKALNCLQGARYIEIAEGRPQDETFIYGWLRTRVA